MAFDIAAISRMARTARTPAATPSPPTRLVGATPGCYALLISDVIRTCCRDTSNRM